MPESGYCQRKMPISEHQNFQSRLWRVLNDRRPYPWAAGLGITRGTVSRMLNGEIPGPEILGRIMRAENASITWLTEGIGAPYLVHWCPTDGDCRERLAELLDFQQWEAAHLVTDADQLGVVVLQAPGEKEYGEDEVLRYTELEVLAGCGRRAVDALARLAEFRWSKLDTATVAEIASGRRAGTHELLRADAALLRDYEIIRPGELKVAETPVLYGPEGADASSAEERELVAIHRELDPEHRVRLKEVGSAFAAAQRLRRETADNDE